MPTNRNQGAPYNKPSTTRAQRAAAAKAKREADAIEQRDAAVAKIAEEMGIETLETRNSDSLDFKDIPVWRLKAALEAAYRAGKASK